MSRFTRRLSERTSRRSAISRIARWTMGLTGVAVVASLPVTRDPKATAQSGSAAPTSPAAAPPDGATPFGEGDDLIPTYDGKDPTKCNYWRWCNMDGTLYSLCRRRHSHLCTRVQARSRVLGGLLHEPGRRQNLPHRLLRLLRGAGLLHHLLR